MRRLLVSTLFLAVVATACGGSSDEPIVVQTTTTGMFTTTTTTTPVDDTGTTTSTTYGTATTTYGTATTTTYGTATTTTYGTATTTTEPSAATTTEPSTDGPESVTVEKGDSLSKIAKRYGTTVDALVRINELCDANQIFVGQVILLEDPNFDASAEETATSTVIVTVEVGDSLTKIAKRHDTSVEAIMELNDIDDPNLLFVGQELVIDGEVPTAEEAEENPNC
ncbi:MAG: LysM domain-containing protein [Actinomycetota bacterium]|nr:LysM domain-containing protein [Actinomycetota bacterium]MED5166069.1 LysM domain-containing protein [Actinomycetota bacterium]